MGDEVTRSQNKNSNFQNNLNKEDIAVSAEGGRAILR